MVNDRRLRRLANGDQTVVPGEILLFLGLLAMSELAAKQTGPGNLADRRHRHDDR